MRLHVEETKNNVIIIMQNNEILDIFFETISKMQQKEHEVFFP